MTEYEYGLTLYKKRKYTRKIIGDNCLQEVSASATTWETRGVGGPGEATKNTKKIWQMKTSVEEGMITCTKVSWQHEPLK